MGAAAGALATALGVVVARSWPAANGPVMAAIAGSAGLAGIAAAGWWGRQCRRASARDAMLTEERWLLTARLQEVEGLWQEAKRLAGTAQAESARRQKLEQTVLALHPQFTLGRVAGGVAHSFNNLLVGIMGYASAAEEVDQLTEVELRQYLAQIYAASQRASALCYQLMVAAGRRSSEPREIFLHRFRAEVAPLLEACAGRGATFTIRLEPRLPRVRADLAGLQLALVNLVFNALDATGLQNTVLTLVVQQVQFEVAPVGLSGRIRPGRYVRFVLQDEGAGLAPGLGEQIYEPFFSTRSGRLGVGLSGVRRWAEALGGGLRVGPGPVGSSGTVAEILLPAIVPPDELSGPVPGGSMATVLTAESVPPGPRSRVLFVDDDETVRELAAMLLRQLGADVVCAESGAEALRQFREEGPFDLAMVDYSMPGLNGVETVLRLREFAPGLPVVIVSGSLRSDIEDLPRLGSLAGFLQKPFNFGEVRDLVGSLGL